MFSNADIFLGQLYRKATHIRRFENATRNPGAAQEDRLLRIIRSNADSAYGKKHHFDRINSVADFRKYVPVNKYEDLQPYIDAAKNGQSAQLSMEDPFMFATTSGTTAQPKFIPITESHLLDYTHAFQVHNYNMVTSFPHVAQGRFLIITSNDQEGTVASGKPYGAVSGVLNRRQSKLIRRHFAIPYEICKIKDVDMKYYLMLRVALAQSVTAILSCNPSSLLLLADQLKEHAGDLVADVSDGTIKSKYAPPAHLAHAFEP
ncbi:MAG: GH3 family domain-containing protein, partial [Terriglobales bacterium]